KLRRLLREKVARGHVELTLSLDRGGTEGFGLNRELVGGYIQAFRAAAPEFSIAAQPDLNVILRMPGAMDASTGAAEGELEADVLPQLEEARVSLNSMRAEERRCIERELRERMQHIQTASSGVERHRNAILQIYFETLWGRMHELIGAHVEPECLLQEACLLIDRSDIEEDLVKLQTHNHIFLGLLEEKDD